MGLLLTLTLCLYALTSLKTVQKEHWYVHAVCSVVHLFYLLQVISSLIELMKLMGPNYITGVKMKIIAMLR